MWFGVLDEAALVNRLADVVTDLHALRPVAQLLAQKQRVERVRADPVEELAEHLLDEFGVDRVQLEHLQEGVQLQKQE